MKSFKLGFGFVLTIAIMVLMSSLGLISFTNGVLLNNKFYEKTLNKGQFYEKLEDEIRGGLKNYSVISTVPEDVFQESLKDSKIKEICEKNIRHGVDYLKGDEEYLREEFKWPELEKNLDEFLRGYIAENKLEITDELKNQIKGVHLEAKKIVLSHAELLQINHVLEYREFQGFRAEIERVSHSFIWVFGITILALGVLKLIFSKELKKFVILLSEAFIGSSLVFLVPSIMGIISRVAHRINIENLYLKIALRDIILGYFRYFIVLGCSTLCIGLFLMYLSRKIKNSQATQCDVA